MPRGVKAEASSDREQFFLGENPVVRFTVTNRGLFPFWVFDGGDYRGGTRPWHFSITVRDERGEKLPDPMPEQVMMGGMGQYHFLWPGERHTYTTLLNRYALVDRPGRYRVEVSHDLGTKRFPGDGGPAAPVAGFTLEFLAPTASQAREIAARARPLWQWPTAQSRSEELDEFVNLRFPIYLPAVHDALLRGDANALQALGHMGGQVATEQLVAWSTRADAMPSVRSGALLMLAARAPVADPHARSPHVVISPALLQVGAWNDALRRAALVPARARLADGFAAPGDEATAAATLVGALGEPQDADRLLALWRELAEKHRVQGGVSTELGPTGYSLCAALAELRSRGWSPPFPLTDDGDIHLWLFFAQREREQERGAFSPEVWSTLVALREHPQAQVRAEVAELLRPPSAPRLGSAHTN